MSEIAAEQTPDRKRFIATLIGFSAVLMWALLALFTAASDIAYREGSIYKQMDDGLLLWVSLSILMTGFLLMGLIRREQHGPGGIGFESLAVLLLYGLGIALVLGG